MKVQGLGGDWGGEREFRGDLDILGPWWRWTLRVDIQSDGDRSEWKLFCRVFREKGYLQGLLEMKKWFR